MKSQIKEDCVLIDGMLYLCNNIKRGTWRFKIHCRLFHPVDSTSVIPKQVIGHVSQLHPNRTLAVHHITSIPFSDFQVGSQHKTKMHIPCLEFWGPHRLTTHKTLCIVSQRHTSHNPQDTLHCITTSYISQPTRHSAFYHSVTHLTTHKTLCIVSQRHTSHNPITRSRL